MPYVLCPGKSSPHTPESVIVKCDICKKELWCSPWNEDKRALCINCATKMAIQIKPVIAERDFARAVEHLNETKASR